MLEITPDTITVNVNRHVIDANSKLLKENSLAQAFPPISVRKGKRGTPEYGHEVAILDKDGEEVARFIYSANGKLLSCGARIVLVAHHGAKVMND